MIDEQAPDNAGAIAPGDAASSGGATAPVSGGPADGGANPADPATPGPGAAGAPPAAGAPAQGDLAGGDPASGDPTDPAAAGDAPTDDATAAAADAAAADPTVNQEAAELTAPEGAGWVVQLKGYHVHNEQGTATAMEYVRATLLNYLENGEVELPIGKNPNDPEGPPLTATFTMKELGIHYAVITNGTRIMDSSLPNPKYIGATSLAGMGGSGEGGEESEGDLGPSIGSMGGGAGMSLGAPPGPGAAAGGGLGARPGGGLASGSSGGSETEEETEPPTVPVKRVDFTIQFCWQPQPLSERLEARRKKEEERQQAANAGGDVAANLTGNGGT